MRLDERRIWPLAVLLLVLMVGCKQPTTITESETRDLATEFDRDRDVDDDDEDGGVAMPFADAEVFFEFNTTDNDLGLQIFLDAEGWRKVKVSDPDGEKIVQFQAAGNLSELGITELRFESAEPSPAEVLALFPPGEYEFRGWTVEGGRLASTGELSHDFLPAPTFSPSDGDVVDPNNTVITWNAPGAEQVEIILESDDVDDTFDVIISSESGSLNVPPQFLQPGTEYKIEILAIAENGNKTIAESDFVTMP